MKLIITIGIFTFLWSVICQAEDETNATDWHRWRGPNRDGISSEGGWSSTWPEDGPEILWKVSVGLGYSSVSVSNGRVYTMGNVKNKDTVYCLNADTGDVVWEHSYECKQGSWEGTRIAPTVDGDRVYTLSRGGHLFCLNAASGDIIWSKNLKGDLKAKMPQHGFACHPFIVDNMMILETGAAAGSIVAFDKMNGDVIWQSGKAKVGYSTPSLYRLDGKDYLTVFTGMNLLGINIPDGKILWRHEWPTEYQCNIATPIVSDDRIFISAGYSAGCALLQTNRDGDPKLLWKNEEMANHINTSVLWNGYLYGFHGAPKHNNDKGQLRCVDIETGDVKWKQDGLGKGSLMIADGKLVILGEKGELAIVEPSPDSYKELARAKVIDGTCWTVPVLSNGRIYCRSHEGDLVCVDVREH
ncbi:PQQ-binding-like beta-propeller repeat protein [Candidatus Poribacteria bacterium]